MPCDGARRFAPTPLQRGTAVVVVAGGALSLISATTPGLLQDASAPAVYPDIAPVARTLALEPAAPAVPVAIMVASVLPVAPVPEVVDAADLVKAVQLAEQEIARLAAEERAAQERAAAAAAAKEEATKVAAARVVRAGSSSGGSSSAGASSAGASSDCGLDTSSLGAVKKHVREAASFLGCLFGEPTILGVAGRGGSSDHPGGLALDFMVDRATGDALAACALRNQDALGITYVIWRQRINHGNGFTAMEDRGSATANHFDHVHISFDPSRGTGEPRSC